MPFLRLRSISQRIFIEATSGFISGSIALGMMTLMPFAPRNCPLGSPSAPGATPFVLGRVVS